MSFILLAVTVLSIIGAAFKWRAVIKPQRSHEMPSLGGAIFLTVIAAALGSASLWFWI